VNDERSMRIPCKAHGAEIDEPCGIANGVPWWCGGRVNLNLHVIRIERRQAAEIAQLEEEMGEIYRVEE